jgi:hypothetical protein
MHYDQCWESLRDVDVPRNATIVADDTHATVIIAGQVVRYLTIDRSRKYQPSGRSRGSSARPRLTT